MDLENIKLAVGLITGVLVLTGATLLYVIVTQQDQIAALGRYESALVDNQNKQANDVDKLTETVGKLIDGVNGQK